VLVADHHPGGLINMAKVYFVRHQAAGIVTKYPFAQEPTEAQVAAIVRECFQSFGGSHQKTPDVPYWVRVESFDLLDANTVPEVQERSLSVANVAAVGEVTVNAVGTVTPQGAE
jgi:hypothetical protein